jgi:hypothetical protein
VSITGLKTLVWQRRRPTAMTSRQGRRSGQGIG